MDAWLTSLITDSPQAGYERAFILTGAAIKYTQIDPKIRVDIRAQYVAGALIASAHVVATHSATIAAANRYWAETDGVKT